MRPLYGREDFERVEIALVVRLNFKHYFKNHMKLPIVARLQP
jgi:hypothetical protein